MTVSAVVLAAGEGRRLGQPKALLEVDGERLVDRAVRTARGAGCDLVTVVLGAAVTEVPGADLVVINDQWRTGMGSSLRTGLLALVPRVDAAVMLLVDQPGIGPDAVRRVLAAHESGAEVAVATYAGQRRTPVLVTRRHWGEVIRLAVGDVGARPFLKANPDLVEAVPCGDIADPHDIDTPEDLSRLTGR